MARAHKMTAARKAALRKAQLASARKRKGRGKSKKRLPVGTHMQLYLQYRENRRHVMMYGKGIDQKRSLLKQNTKNYKSAKKRFMV